MKQIIKYPFFVFFVLGLICCSESSNEKKIKPKSDTKSQINNNPGFIIEEDISSDEPVAGSSLANFIPSKISGTSTLPLKIGSIDEGKFVITTVSREYIFSNKGFIKFIITDYGKKVNIPKFELKLLNEPPEESGKLTQIITVPHGKGYSLWEEVKRSGSFYGIVQNRFLLRIDGYNLPSDFHGFQDYVHFFNINGLINFSKNH